jgi:hypothetical protein
MKRYKKIIKEAEENKTQDSINALIAIPKLDTEESKGKFLELIKGIVFSNTAQGNKFLNKINDFTSTLNKQEFQEEISIKEDGQCPSGGCIKKIGNDWRIYSAKDGHVWPQTYETKEKAEAALAAYHVHH